MSKVYVFGHQKPDTDAVTSAIALAYLKRQLGVNAEPRILSDINKETKFVLKKFGVNKPRYLDSVKLQLKDINYYRDYYMNFHLSLNALYTFLIDRQITGVPIVDDDRKLLGIVTFKDLMKHMKNSNNYINTNYDNIIDILHGREITRKTEEIKGDIILKDNNLLVINDNEVVLLIISKDSAFKKHKFTNINMIDTDLRLIDMVRLFPWSNYISDIISGDRFYKFSENAYYDDFIKETNKLHFNNYPIIGKNNKCRGLIRITDIVTKDKKKVILVDHNEPHQSVDGLEEAEIVEIIDHHKIGSISTNNPISFRNMTVGSTSTIIYRLYKENNIDVPDNMAGLMLSGILSDTLGLTSSTTTHIDKTVVSELSELLHMNYKDYFLEMLEAGTSTEGVTKEDVVKQDLKYFQVNNERYAVSQTVTLDINSILKDKDEYLKIINDYKNNHELALMILIITDAIQQGSYILYTDGVEEMIREIYNLEDVYEGVFVANLTSRKQQVVPYINEYLK